MASKDHATGCADVGAPAPEHKKFESFVGTFTAQVKLWMGPGDPHVSTGIMTNALDLGGRFLKQTYKGDPGAAPFPNFEGRGYWGYNTVDRKYEGFWIDTACTLMQFEKGGVDASGKVWTMIGEMTDPQSGGKMRKRSVITLKDNDRHTMEMYFAGPDGKEAKCMEIAYARKR
jgi:hypothetical protein